MTARVGSTAPVRSAPTLRPAVTTALAPTSLLPEPSAGSLAGTDALSLLFLFESKEGKNDEKSASVKLNAIETERHDAVQKEQEAIQKAVEASQHQSFWDDLGNVCGEIAKVAGLVAAVAAAIGTAGALAPVAWAGVALSSAGLLDGETHLLQKLGVSADVAGWIDAGLSLGGGVTAAGAALFGEKAAAAVATKAVSTASVVVSGVTSIGKGASEVESAHERAESDRAAADEVAAQATSDHLGRMIESLLIQLKSSDEKSQHIMSTIAQTKTIQNETVLAAAAGIRG